MSGYLIYHPGRRQSRFGNVSVYHDHNGANQDPYVWNRQSLHTYCHITQMSPAVGDINFWVSGDTFPKFSHLYCDVVFVVQSKMYWREANANDRRDPMVESDEAFTDHYQWIKCQHHFKRRKRYTLKADPERSFQPQDENGALIDIVPFLSDAGLPLDSLRRGLRAGFNSKPFRLGEVAVELYEWLDQNAMIRLNGEQLQAIRRAHPHLASPSR